MSKQLNTHACQRVSDGHKMGSSRADIPVVIMLCVAIHMPRVVYQISLPALPVNGRLSPFSLHLSPPVTATTALHGLGLLLAQGREPAMWFFYSWASWGELATSSELWLTLGRLLQPEVYVQDVMQLLGGSRVEAGASSSLSTAAGD